MEGNSIQSFARVLAACMVVAVLVAATVFAWQSHAVAAVAEDRAEDMAVLLNVGDQLKDRARELFTGRSELARLTAERDILRRRAWEWCGLFVAASLLAVALAYLTLGERRVTLAAALVTTMVSAICGITAPALAISAQHGTPLGEIGLYHESRSILATIAQLLGADGSLIVGLPLLLFSIVMPLAKTIGLGVVLAVPKRAGPPVLGFVHRIGRWSMADVFVVALLLSFFATSHNRHLDATLLPGLAFFTHYAIGSLVVAARIEFALAPPPR